jgi:hypothetical protein
VLAAAVSAAARVAAQRWLQPEPDTTFSDMLNEALTWIVPALRAADQSPQPEDSAMIRISDSTRQATFTTAIGDGL